MAVTRPDLWQAEPSRITDHVLLGDKRQASNLAMLRRLGVRRVLTIAREVDLRHVLAGSEIRHMWISKADSEDEDLLEVLSAAFGFIGEGGPAACGSDSRRAYARANADEAVAANEQVLVHCLAGISRSATVVLAYLMQSHRMTFRDAIVHVKSRRPIVYPNSGFLRQLVAFERSLYGEESVPDHMLPKSTYSS
jgi:predicted protein tyrosine phosphatase